MQRDATAISQRKVGARPGDQPVVTGCPHLAGYNPVAPAELSDPYTRFVEVRRDTPVYYLENWDMYEVSRLDDVLTVLRDDDNYSTRRALPVEPPPPEVTDRMPEYPWAKSLLLLDDPEHRPARSVVQAPFTPRKVRERDATIRAVANRLFDERMAAGRIDFINEYSLPLSLAAIADIMGVPEEKWELLHDGVARGFELISLSLTDHDEIVKAAEPLADLYEYLGELVEERREDPRDDYTTVMVQYRKEDGTLESTPEMIKHLYTLLGAGFETSAQMMAHGIGSILAHPDQWEDLKVDPEGLIDGAVEEMLRYRTLVKRIFRVTNRDMEVGGVTIPEGALVSLLLASADRDEDAYEQPQDFDIRRRPEHLAFGKWKHFCVGAPLARLEMKITVETIIDRVPDIRPVPGQKFEWRPDLRLDAINRLELEWEPSRAD